MGGWQNKDVLPSRALAARASLKHEAGLDGQRVLETFPGLRARASLKHLNELASLGDVRHIPAGPY